MVFPYMFIPNVYPKMVKNIVNNPDLSLDPEKLRIDLLTHFVSNKRTPPTSGCFKLIKFTKMTENWGM